MRRLQRPDGREAPGKNCSWFGSEDRRLTLCPYDHETHANEFVLDLGECPISCTAQKNGRCPRNFAGVVNNRHHTVIAGDSFVLLKTEQENCDANHPD